jgi:CubicO group peptidase (beta-lactamase class C family)
MNNHISRRQFVLGGVSAGILATLPACARHSAAVRTGGSRLGSQGRAQLTELEGLIADLLGEAVVPGVAIAPVKDGAVAWHRAFGVRDADSRQPVDERTVFAAASVSKTVFAYATMQLCDRGVLELDTPLTRYTPDRILEGDPRLDLITARHVLSHTSGLPNFRSGASPLRIHFTPGKRFQYSGEGYWYLQSVITHLTGRVDSSQCADYEAGMRQCATDIDSYLTANVLAPCHMPSSGYVGNSNFERHGARGHDSMGRALPAGQSSASDAGRYAAMGGLRTTALDYGAFLSEVLAPRTAPSFRLAAATRQEMLRPQVHVEGPKSWALGWEINDTPGGRLFQHQGGQAGAQAFTAASLERRSGYVILTNSDNGWKGFYDERFVGLANEILLT